MPKVSICIPCYNNAEEVSRLLDSILQQDFRDYEVNISDDSTNNETSKLVEQYKDKIINLNYVHNDKPLGHIFNWNAAIKMATGEYIKIMFSDDWFTENDSLSELVKLLDSHIEAIFAFSGSRQVMLDKPNIENMQHVTSEHNKASYSRYAPKEYIDTLRKDYRYLFQSNQIGAPSSIIYRRDSEGNIALFDEKSNWASDVFLYFELFDKAFDQSKAFAYTTRPLITIGVHENQYTETFSEKDMRIYNDYKYMYTKYRLYTSEKYREYFTENYIVKYHQSLKEARSLHIEKSLFVKKYFNEIKLSIQCYIEYHFIKKHKKEE